MRYCEHCEGAGDWLLRRAGDGFTSWACDEHLALDLTRLQRHDQATQITVTAWAGQREPDAYRAASAKADALTPHALRDACPNDCHGQPIPCWNPGGPCPPGQMSCENCGECAFCRAAAHCTCDTGF